MSEFTGTNLRGKIIVKHGFPFKGEYFSSEGNYVVLTPGNFEESGGFKFDLDKAKFYAGKIPSDYICNKGDLIVAMTEQAEGLLGSAAIVPEDNRFLHNQRIGLITVNEKELHKMFLYHLFKTKNVRQQLRRSSSGSKVKHTSPDRIYDVIVNIPSVPTQQKIASVLSALDSKIELNNRINAELQAIAKTLYDYWFVQFDFPDQHGKPYKSSGGEMVWNEKLKREIPDGWEVCELEDIVRCNYRSINQDEQYKCINYLDTSNLTENVVDSIQNINLEYEKRPSRAQRIIEKNDILYSTVRPNQRHFGIIKDVKDNLIASTGFAQLTSKIEVIKNELIYIYLTSESSINRLQQIADSSVSSYPSISPNDLLGLTIALPNNKTIIEYICSILEPMFENMSVNQKQNNQLAELRDWVLPILMNGQVTVRNVSLEE